MFSLHPNTRILIDALKQLPEDGGAISYNALSDLVGADVRIGNGRTWLVSARKYCEREHQITFDVSRGVGLIRAHAGAVVDLVSSDRKRVHSAANRAMRRSECVKNEDLSTEEQAKLSAQQAICGMVAQCTKHRAEKKLTSHAEAASSNGERLRMTIQQTLEFFKGH